MVENSVTNDHNSEAAFSTELQKANYYSVP